MTELTREQIAARHQLIRKAPCRRADGGCGAKPGDPCRTPKGHATAPHGIRRVAAMTSGYWSPG